MNLSLSPEIEHHIHEQVKSGRFRSPEEVVEAAIGELVHPDMAEELSEQDIAAIAIGDAQVDRGEVIGFDEFRAAFSKRLGVSK